MRPAARFAVNAFSNWTQRAVAIGVGVVMMPYAIHHLGQTRYGVFGILGSLIGMLGLLDMGLSSGVSRFSSQDQAAGNLRALRGVATVAQLLQGGVGVVGGTIIAFSPPWMALFFNIDAHYYEELRLLSICMAVSFCFSFLSVAPRGLIIGGNRYDLANAVDVAANLTRLALLFILFESFKPSLFLFGIIYATYDVMRYFLYWSLARFWVVKTKTFSVAEVSWDIVKRFGSFSAMNAIGVAGGMLMSQGPNFVVGKMLGPAMVTAFAPTLLVAGQLRAAVIGFVAPLLPLAGRNVATEGGARLADWSVRFSRLACIMSLTILVPVIAYARPIIGMWIGSDYEWTTPVFVIMSLSQLFASIQVANYYLALGGGRIRPWAMTSFGAAATAVILSALGTWLFGWGLLGVAIVVGVVIAGRTGITLPLIA